MARRGQPVGVVAVLGWGILALGLLGCLLCVLGLAFVCVVESTRPPCPPGSVCDGAGNIIAATVVLFGPACLAMCAVGGTFVVLGRQLDRNRTFRDGR